MKKIILIVSVVLTSFQAVQADFFDRETKVMIGQGIGPYVAGGFAALGEAVAKNSTVRDLLNSRPAAAVAAVSAGYMLQDLADKCSDKGRSSLTRVVLFSAGTAAAAYECTSSYARTFLITAGAGVAAVNLWRYFSQPHAVSNVGKKVTDTLVVRNATSLTGSLGADGTLNPPGFEDVLPPTKK